MNYHNQYEEMFRSMRRNCCIWPVILCEPHESVHTDGGLKSFRRTRLGFRLLHLSLFFSSAVWRSVCSIPLLMMIRSFFFARNEQKKRIKNKSTWMMPTDESQLISIFRNSPVTNETATFALSHANFFSQTDLNLMRLALKGIALNAARECTTMLTVITRDGLIEFHYMSTMYKILFTKFTQFSIFPDFLWMRNFFLCVLYTRWGWFLFNCMPCHAMAPFIYCVCPPCLTFSLILSVAKEKWICAFGGIDYIVEKKERERVSAPLFVNASQWRQNKCFNRNIAYTLKRTTH